MEEDEVDVLLPVAEADEVDVPLIASGRGRRRRGFVGDGMNYNERKAQKLKITRILRKKVRVQMSRLLNVEL
jgi:hypothetical protein